MSRERELLERAVNWMFVVGCSNSDICQLCDEIHEELAKPGSEPVAWMCQNDPDRNSAFYWGPGRCDNGKCVDPLIPLYTSPPARKPLSDKDVLDIYIQACKTETAYRSVEEFARLIQKAHGII